MHHGSRPIVLAALAAAAASCSSGSQPPHDAAALDAGADVTVVRDAAMDTPDTVGPTDVPFAPDVHALDVTVGGTYCAHGADVPGVTVPAGFCLRHFGAVPEARALAFAPNGDLFVASPSAYAPGGAHGGISGVAVMTDDDHDGVADTNGGAAYQVFVAHVTDVQGLAFGGGYLYFTTTSDVFRTQYTAGQRGELFATRTALGLPSGYGMGGRWTHGLAMSPGGVLYTSSAESGSCTPPGMSIGNITRIGMGSSTVVASGFRNPMYMRCHFRDEVCLASELGEDQQTGAREKLVVVRTGDDYGYPCCYATDVDGPGAPTGRCASVAPEAAEFTIGDTPFGLDWERGGWPAPFTNGLFVALHGSYYTTPSWLGAGIVYLPTDPITHVPTGTKTLFVDGFGPGGSPLERPSDVAFAADGRMFFSDDLAGDVYWVAPTSLAIPSP